MLPDEEPHIPNKKARGAGTPQARDQNPNYQEEEQIMTNAIPNGLIGVNASCPEPGCDSRVELHGPSEAGTSVPVVHTIPDVEDPHGLFRVGGQRVDGEPWTLFVETVSSALPLTKGQVLASALVAQSHVLVPLELARLEKGEGGAGA